MIILRSLILIMRYVSDRFVEKIKTHILCAIHFFFGKVGVGDCAFYEIRWENIAEPDRPQMTIRRMRCARKIIMATNTHSEYVILIALPLQQWFTKASSCQVTRTLPVLFIILMFHLVYNYVCVCFVF